MACSVRPRGWNHDRTSNSAIGGSNLSLDASKIKPSRDREGFKISLSIATRLFNLFCSGHNNENKTAVLYGIFYIDELPRSAHLRNPNLWLFFYYKKS